ncbi:MAG: glycoside hydrolase family 125 protein [bacterium]
MTHNSLPNVPWQLTGNHWLALPCIHPADGSIHVVGMLHRGARAAVEFAGDPNFVDGEGAPLLKPLVAIDGIVQDLSAGTMVWERAAAWLPTFTCTLGDIVVRGTIFAPYGRDADVAGAVYAFGVESRSTVARTVVVSMQGRLGYRQLRVRTGRPAEDASRVSKSAGDLVLMEGSAQPGLVALALGADGHADVEVHDTSFSIACTVAVAPGESGQAAFYLAAGPERDGAEATAAVLRRRGWRALLAGTRDALQQLEQSTGNEAMDRLINRNLLFSYFFGVARALDDAHYYLVRTRAPWHGAGVTVRDWDALMWTLPAVQLADHGLAREVLLRMCELHAYAPGRGVHYLDGTLFEPGFALEGVAAYPIAVDRYIRDTGDDAVVDEPAIGDALYLASDDLRDRRDQRVPLYSTDVTPSGDASAYPFTLHGNATVAQALEVLKRTLDEQTARDVEDPAAVRAAIKRHFAADRDPKGKLAASIDLAGHRSEDDVASASALWLPLYEALDRQDSLYRRTVKAIPSEASLLVRQIARLLGPDGEAVLQWLRRAPLHGGLAAEFVDDAGAAVANGGDAALSGLLAATAWHAVHVLGMKG